MIKFFRQVRHQLVLRNKISKYLFYALGEIILVVIGILIALSINNWNEENKNRTLEDQYYIRLYEDVQQDDKRIKKLLSQIEERKSDANQLLRLVLNGEFNARDINLQYVKTIRGSAINFEPNDAAYEDLKSSGNLNLIQDIDIKDKLNNYFKRIEQLVKTNQVYIDYTTEQYFKISEYHKQTGGVIAHLTSDEMGVPGYKFEEDIVEDLLEYEIDQLPKAYHDTYFNLAYNMAANMERREQHLGLIKEDISIIKDVLEEKCLEINKN